MVGDTLAFADPDRSGLGPPERAVLRRRRGLSDHPAFGVVGAPVSMLCKVDWWDGTSTVFWYTTSGQLGRIVDPGGVTTDYAWASGRLAVGAHPARRGR